MFKSENGQYDPLTLLVFVLVVVILVFVLLRLT
ncbi:MAG: hypothetical protein QOF51_2351 [Chloroflexota bacterium]|jgi:flagellin-like protein|nr:hypothetical protein [Chloroflexota bacterium]